MPLSPSLSGLCAFFLFTLGHLGAACAFPAANVPVGGHAQSWGISRQKKVLRVYVGIFYAETYVVVSHNLMSNCSRWCFLSPPLSHLLPHPTLHVAYRLCALVSSHSLQLIQVVVVVQWEGECRIIYRQVIQQWEEQE